MVTESFLATALPTEADPARPVHVSVFISHRLTPDGAEGVVSDFPNITDWPKAVSAARIVLTGHTAGGPTVDIPVTADLSLLDSVLWSVVFPGDFPVRPWNTPDLAGDSVADVRGPPHAAALAARARRGDLVVTRRPAVGARQRVDGGCDEHDRPRPVVQAGSAVEDVIDPELDLDGRATNFLDDVSGGGFVGAGSPSADDQQPVRADGPDAHRARRYYQTPEEAKKYFDHPQPGASAMPLSRPKPDFHERASGVGDLSPLLRRLGLVVDLRIDDLSMLNGVVAIQADLLVDGLDNAVASQPARLRGAGTSVLRHQRDG